MRELIQRVKVLLVAPNYKIGWYVARNASSDRIRALNTSYKRSVSDANLNNAYAMVKDEITYKALLVELLKKSTRIYVLVDDVFNMKKSWHEGDGCLIMSTRKYDRLKGLSVFMRMLLDKKIFTIKSLIRKLEIDTTNSTSLRYWLDGYSEELVDKHESVFD